MPFVIIFFLIVIGVGVSIFFGNIKRNAQAFEVFSQLAKKYQGQVPSSGKYLMPTLIIPIEEEKLIINYMLMRKATGQQIGANCLIFRLRSQRLAQSLNLIVWTSFGWRKVTKAVGMEKYKINDPVFDEKFIIHKKGTDAKVQALLNSELREKIIKAKEGTERLDINKRGFWLDMEYQVLTVEGPDKVEKALELFSAVYHAFVRSATSN